MTVPIINADLWLDRTTFGTIIALVAEMQTRIRRDECPLPFTSETYIAGALVKANGPAKTAREIRAQATLNQNCVIQLEHFPEAYDDIGPLRDDPGAFRTAILGVLAHEASHVMQWTVARDEQAHAESSEASKAARISEKYSDYIAYLATPLELAAHSTQLAVEVWAEKGSDLDQAGFQDAAVLSSLWTHMTNHPISRPACADSGASEFAPVREPLLSNGWWIYQRLMRADTAHEE